MSSVSWANLKADIAKFLTTSQEEWPADYGNYGPLFVRLAWHNAGSYRTSDGRGGADGARQRFDPERSWDDNTNLDKARSLLFAVKRKWPMVSWGDLIVLTGNVAIESMGGPALGFCAGRVDDDDGTESILLGPNEEQEAYAPCPVNGNCSEPLGSTTVGLIYVNPQGPMGQPDTRQSAVQVRDTFGRMAMNDSETVALIGGGHAFGKTHGACPDGPGPSPAEDPTNPWPGKCGSGKGADAYTSGIEGPWTQNPTSWDNQYFKLLDGWSWEVAKGPGDAWQWHPTGGVIFNAPAVNGSGGTEATMMMTSDISLTIDPSYRQFVSLFASNMEAFEKAFSAAWYKLMTRDLGPITRCAKTDELLQPQPFQYPLPPSTTNLTNQTMQMLSTTLDSLFAQHQADNASVVAAVARLAWACASTFRQTDYLGGCNGGRIRFSPAKDWAPNAGLDIALDALAPVQASFPISWADLIMLAGGRALSYASSSPLELPFCDGRADALDGSGAEYLEPTLVGDVNETADNLKEVAHRMGLTNRDFVALLGARRSLGSAVAPFEGPFTLDPTTLDNAYFQTLIDESWERYAVPTTGAVQYKTKSGTPIYAQSTDINVRIDPELLAIAQQYAADNDVFIADLRRAWIKFSNNDRFDKPHCLLGTYF